MTSRFCKMFFELDQWPHNPQTRTWLVGSLRWKPKGNTWFVPYCNHFNTIILFVHYSGSLSILRTLKFHLQINRTKGSQHVTRCNCSAIEGVPTLWYVLASDTQLEEVGTNPELNSSNLVQFLSALTGYRIETCLQFELQTPVN